MWKDRDVSSGIAATVDDGSMVGGIGEDFNIGGGNGGDGRMVRLVASRKENGIVETEELRQFILKCAVDASAGGQARAAGPGAEMSNCLGGS